MKKYESVIIIQSNLTQNQIKDIIGKVKNKIEEYSIITKIEELGNRKLAYDIKNNKTGYYVVFEFEVDNNKNVISEIERYYRIQDEIIKFIVVKRD